MPDTHIISASVRTDIPAFHARWFMAALRARRVAVPNPVSGVHYAVDLRRDAVAGFVFWTRNMRPLMRDLPEISAVAPFMVQYTLTDYPKALDRAVISADRAIAQMRELAAAYGPRCVVWRHDPIVLTDVTDADWHRDVVARHAAALAGVVDEMVTSFVEPYAKTLRNMGKAGFVAGDNWLLPDEGAKIALLDDLRAITSQHGIRLSLCTQPALEMPLAGRVAAACIDAARLSDLGATGLQVPVKPNRPGCLCAAARDIGWYDSCAHGCHYCYAVRDHAAMTEGALTRPDLPDQ